MLAHEFSIPTGGRDVSGECRTGPEAGASEADGASRGKRVIRGRFWRAVRLVSSASRRSNRSRLRNPCSASSSPVGGHRTRPAGSPPAHGVASNIQLSSADVEKLALSLGIPHAEMIEHRWHFPDGSVFCSPRYRWCLLVKAVVEKFCPAFSPSSAVIYIGDTENTFVDRETECLAAFGVTLASATKRPDTIVDDITKNRLLLIEAVSRAGSVDEMRRNELKELFTGCKVGLVFVTAFESRRTLQSCISDIAGEAEVWVADHPDHLIHDNGSVFSAPILMSRGLHDFHSIHPYLHLCLTP